MPRRPPADLEDLLARWAPPRPEAPPAPPAPAADAPASPPAAAPSATTARPSATTKSVSAAPAPADPSALFAHLRDAMARAFEPGSKKLAAALRLVDNVQCKAITAGPRPTAKTLDELEDLLDELEDLLEGLWIAAEDDRRRKQSG